MQTENLKKTGAALIANGYLVVPIKPGEKRPAIKDWELTRLTAADCTTFGNCGAGVLCGQGEYPLAAFDIDSSNEALVKEFSEWCFDNLGPACERIGNAPKLLLVYRAGQSGWRKSTGAWFSDASGSRQRLEILGHGQQFVAYHIHPETQQPYTWVDMFGGLTAVGASALPVVSQEQIAQALQVFEEMAIKHGLTRVAGSANTLGGTVSSDVLDDPLSCAQRSDITLDEAKALVEHLDSQDYDVWLSVGMALHFEFEGSSEALALWDEWSANASNYQSFEDLNFRWQGFKADGVAVKGAGWLRKAARDSQKAALRDAQQGALEEISEIIQRCASPIDLIGDVAEKVGALSQDSDGLRAIAEGELRSKFKALTGTSLLVADVRKALSKGRVAVKGTAKRPIQYPLTDLGNVHRFMDVYGENLLYVLGQKSPWYLWNAIFWEPLPGEFLGEMIQHVVEDELPKELKAIRDDDLRKKHIDHCFKSQQERQLSALRRALQNNNDRLKKYKTEELNANLSLLGVRNGVVDLTSGQLLPASKDYLITVTTGVDYDTNAKCPLWMKTLRDVFSSDEEMVACFQRLIGFTLMGKPELEPSFVILYGTGANGKTTVLNIIKKVFGGHAAKAKPELFLRKKRDISNGENASPGVMKLRGKRFVYLGESEEGSELNESFIKTVTGGEELSARELYSSEVEFKPTWTSYMATNHVPILNGSDPGIRRRIIVLPFTRNFKDEGIADPRLFERLLDELPGILTWGIQGALAYQKLGGLALPEAARLAKQEYIDEMDKLRDFKEQYCELGEGFSEPAKQLHDAYCTWASDNRIKFPLSMDRFYKILSDQGFGRKTKWVEGAAVKVRTGIRLKKDVQVGDF